MANIIYGTAIHLKAKKEIAFDPVPVSKFSLALPDKYHWRIGVDQSTSCTGICCMDTEGTWLVMLDLHRDQNLNRHEFTRDLKRLLSKIVKGLNIDLLVYERPAPKAMYASRILEQLLGVLEDWCYENEDMQNAEKQSIYQQVWKSLVVDASKGHKGARMKDKREVASDIVDIYPMLGRYFSQYPFSDFDSFDACGILTGYIRYAYDAATGLERIHGTEEKTHVSLVGYAWLDNEKATNPVKEVFKFDGAEMIFKPKFLLFNTSKKLVENIRIASSNYDFVWTIIPKEFLKPFMFKYGVDIDDESKTMVAFISRKSNFSNVELRTFEEFLPWNEKIEGQ